MKRYNITVPRKDKNDKTWWDRIGIMFKRDKGGYSIRLSMFPELSIMAFPVEDKPEHHSDTHEVNNVDTEPVEMDSQPIEDVDESQIPF